MSGFFSNLFGSKVAPPEEQRQKQELGIHIQKVFVARGDDPVLMGAVKPLHGLETAIPKRSEELITLQNYGHHLYQQVQNNGRTHLPLGEKHRVSAWVYGDRRSDDWAEMVIVEEKGSDGLWLFNEIKVRGEGPLSYIMLLELPCCEGETSVLVQSRRGEDYRWKLIQSEKALVADIAGRLERRKVQIKPIPHDIDNRMFDEILMHLKGDDHDCTSKDKFGAAYREPR